MYTTHPDHDKTRKGRDQATANSLSDPKSRGACNYSELIGFYNSGVTRLTHSTICRVISNIRRSGRFRSYDDDVRFPLSRISDYLVINILKMRK